MLRLKKLGRIWRVVGQVDGRRYNQSLKTTDRTVAESLKRDLELQVLSGGRLRRVLWPDFAEEWERWKASSVKGTTLDVYRFTVNRFGKFFTEQGLRQVSEITPTVIADYVEDRKKDKHPSRGKLIGPEGIKGDLRILHLVFKYAVDCGYLLANPVIQKKLSPAAGTAQPFREEELTRMLNDEALKKSPYLRAVVLTFLFTGMRRSDVMRLKFEALEVAEGGMILETLKRGKPVTLGVHPELRAALDAHLSRRNKAQRASPLVFANSNGRFPTGMDDMLTRLFERNNIPGGHPHRFRHTFAVRLLAQGASLYDVSKLLGIDIATAEKHYGPYVRELQERATMLITRLSMPGQKVVQFQVPTSGQGDHSDQTKNESQSGFPVTARSAKS